MQPPAISLASPAALVASLPFLVGFPPAESLVLLWMRRGTLRLTQRADLPRRLTDEAVGALMAHPAVRTVDELIAVVVSTQADAGEVGHQVEHAAHARGIVVRDVLASRDGHWWSVACSEPGCPCAVPSPIPPEVLTAVAAEFAYAGVAPVEDRPAMVAEVAPEPCAVLDRATRRRGIAMPETTRAREAWRDRCIDALRRVLAGSTDLRDRALTCRGLTDVRVRDVVLWDLAQMDDVALRRAVPVLQRLVREAPPEVVAPVGTCAAIAAWLLGDGARAAIALHRVQEGDPTYTLAALLARTVEGGVSPDLWRATMASIGLQECRHGTPPQEAPHVVSVGGHRL